MRARRGIMIYTITYFFDEETSRKKWVPASFKYSFSARDEDEFLQKAQNHIQQVNDLFKDPTIKVNIEESPEEILTQLKYRVIYISDRITNKQNTNILEFLIDDEIDHESLAFKKACKHLNDLLKKDSSYVIDEIALFSEQEQKYIPIIQSNPMQHAVIVNEINNRTL